MDLGLSGRVAIVGGASKGIGWSAAMMLAAEGARVVLAARGEEELRRAAATMERQTHAQVLAVPCDLSLETHIRRLVAETVERFDAIDIVVNNAGAPRWGASSSTATMHGATPSSSI